MANTFIFDDDDQPDMGSPMGDPDDDQPDDSESGNRSTFTIIAIVIGGIILVSLICMAVAVVIWLPAQNNARATQQAAALAAQTEAIVAQQQTEEAQATPTLPPTPVLTDTPTSTPVIVFATETPVSETTQDPATATVEALQTQLASAQLTVTSQPSPTLGTPPALSQTGFADEVGLPGLFIVAVILLGVILLARRLREVPTR